MMMTKHLVIIAGPTASGKTGVGIELAKKFNSQIISADSRQIYRETRIGTAVPTSEQLGQVPHHFIQYISLADYYNASMYEMDVIQKLDELFKENNIVFMVGGSGMYINAVCFGIDDLPTVDQEVRTMLAERFQLEGLDRIREDLKRMDPVSYEIIDLNNHYRILKALEVTTQTGRPYSSFLTRKARKRNFDITRIGLDMDREILYNRINARVDSMVEDGLVKEVEGLVSFRKRMP